MIPVNDMRTDSTLIHNKVLDISFGKRFLLLNHLITHLIFDLTVFDFELSFELIRTQIRVKTLGMYHKIYVFGKILALSLINNKIFVKFLNI